jgi:protein TonB
MGIIIGIALIIAGISLYDYFAARRWQQITSADRNEIVFAHRNKEYGAYVLRRDYDRNMAIILFSLFASFALSFGIYKFVKNLPEEKVEGPKVDIIKRTIQTAKKDTPPPPPPPPPAPPPGPKVVANPPPVIMDNAREDEVPTQSEVENVVTGAKDNPGNDDWGAAVPEPGNGPVQQTTVETIEEFVDEEPEYPGGWEAFYTWVSRNMQFPEGSDGGNLNVEVTLSKGGDIYDVRILSSDARELDAEAKRVLLKCNNFRPAKINGKPVNYKFSLPIKFQP